MKDEIKEILDKLKNGFCSALTYEKLLDYITNLNKKYENAVSDYEQEKYLVDKYTRQLTDEYKNTEYQQNEVKRLNNIIEKAIHCINLNQENSGALSYENCKRIRGILKGDEFHLIMFEEQLKELKEGNK